MLCCAAILHGNAGLSPTCRCGHLSAMLHHLLSGFGYKNAMPMVGERVVRNFKWFPPAAGCIKINVDAAVMLMTGCIGLGVVARNERGVCLSRRTKLLHSNVDAECAQRAGHYSWVGAPIGWTLE